MAEQLQNLGVLKMLTAKGPRRGAGRCAEERRPRIATRTKYFARSAASGQRLRIAAWARPAVVAAVRARASAAWWPAVPATVSARAARPKRRSKRWCRTSAPQDLDPVDLDPQAVIAKIRQYRGALVACYEAALKRNPTLAGKITLRFTIGKIGKVTKVDIEADTMHDDDVSACIIDHAKGWRFPPPQSGSDGVQFSYPFIFQASK